jgi:hypothetical protein
MEGELKENRPMKPEFYPLFQTGATIESIARSVITAG